MTEMQLEQRRRIVARMASYIAPAIIAQNGYPATVEEKTEFAKESVLLALMIFDAADGCVVVPADKPFGEGAWGG